MIYGYQIIKVYLLDIYIYIHMSRYKCWMYNSMYIVEIKLVYIYIYVYICTKALYSVSCKSYILDAKNMYLQNYIIIIHYVQEYGDGIYWTIVNIDYVRWPHVFHGFRLRPRCHDALARAGRLTWTEPCAAQQNVFEGSQTSHCRMCHWKTNNWVRCFCWRLMIQPVQPAGDGCIRVL